MTEKRTPELGKVIMLVVADVELLAHVEEWLARFNSFPNRAGS